MGSWVLRCISKLWLEVKRMVPYISLHVIRCTWILARNSLVSRPHPTTWGPEPIQGLTASWQDWVCMYGSAGLLRTHRCFQFTVTNNGCQIEISKNNFPVFQVRQILCRESFSEIKNPTLETAQPTYQGHVPVKMQQIWTEMRKPSTPVPRAPHGNTHAASKGQTGVFNWSSWQMKPHLHPTHPPSCSGGAHC